MSTEPDLPLLSGPTPVTDSKRRVLWKRWADEPMTPPATQAPSTLGSVFFACGMVALSLLVLVGFGQIMAGQTHPNWIVVLASPFMAFLFAGIGIHGGVHIYAHFAQRRDGGEIETRFWRWWTDTVGAGILKLIGGAVAILLAYLALHAVPGNALGGAALSVGGGVLGRGILKGAAALASPVVSDVGRRLADEGITLTPGQIAATTGTKIGNAIKTAEDKATSIPIVGDAINMARRGGVEDFNRATGNKVLASIDQKLPSNVPAGHQMIQHLQNAVSDAYDKALTPLRAHVDDQLADDLKGVVANIRPDQQDAFLKSVREVVGPHFPQSGEPMTGKQLQMIKRGLNEKITQFKGDANGADLAGDLEDLRDSFMQFAERSDPEHAAAYRAADAANAKLKRVEAAAAGTKDGVFSPQQFRQSVGRRGFGTTTANLAAGTAPMQQLATDASTILPSTVPDSGTGGRLLFNQAARHVVPAALGGGIGALEDGKEGALTGAALGAALYSRPGLKAAQYVLAGSRGRTATTLGDLLRTNSSLGGAVGAPALLEERRYR